MNPVSFIVVYIIIWWLVFFIALPIGIKRDENPQLGNSTGAPINPNLKLKIIITSVITFLLTYGFLYLMQQDYFSFVDVRSEINAEK
jgi:predicted secreted protein